MQASALFAASPASRTKPAARAHKTQAQQPRVVSDGAIELSNRAPSRRRLLAALPCGCAACASSASAAALQRPRNAFLDASFARGMAVGMDDYEHSIAPVKRQLFDELLSGLVAGSSGDVLQLLELGIGTGPNLPYYAGFFSDSVTSGSSSSSSSGNSSSSTAAGSAAAVGVSAAAPETAAPAAAAPKLPPLFITGVDPNEYMRPFLEDNLQRAGWPVERFSWVQGDAAALPLPDASVDAVVCTLVLCSVPDVEAVLAESTRVLRPGGQLLFIEHTTAQKGQPLLWLAQRALEPLQRLLADNCHLSRDPLPAIQAAFEGGSGGSVAAGRFNVGEIDSLIAPHVAGLARRGSGGSGVGSLQA